MPFYATILPTGHDRHRHRRKCPRELNLIEYQFCEPEDNGILRIRLNQPERMNDLVGTTKENGIGAEIGEYTP